MNEQKHLLYPEIRDFVYLRIAEFEQIPAARKADLEQLASYVHDSIARAGQANLTFICTHNSRRSHLSQIWARVAAAAEGLAVVQTFSGGTEATAMNPRVVASLRRTGFVVEAETPAAANPVYRVGYSDTFEAIECFSKVYDQSPNPAENYCAVMTCSSADAACPIVPGCELRLPIRYADPKVADDTPQEASMYDERSAQICREMFYVMRQV